MGFHVHSLTKDLLKFGFDGALNNHAFSQFEDRLNHYLFHTSSHRRLNLLCVLDIETNGPVSSLVWIRFQRLGQRQRIGQIALCYADNKKMLWMNQQPESQCHETNQTALHIFKNANEAQNWFKLNGVTV